MILEPFVTMELCSPSRVYSDNIAGTLGRSISLVFKKQVYIYEKVFDFEDLS